MRSQKGATSPFLAVVNAHELSDAETIDHLFTLWKVVIHGVGYLFVRSRETSDLSLAVGIDDDEVTE